MKYKVETVLRGYDIPLVTPEQMGFSSAIGNHHAGSGGPYLETVLRHLEIHADDSLLDVGCGSGAAIITFAKFPFSHIEGIEMSSDMVQRAHANLRRARLREDRVQIITGNAADFTDFNRFSHVYMFNPFPAVVMESVAFHIMQSFKNCGRPRRVIYKNPACHEVLMRQGFREVDRFELDRTFVVYSLE